MSRRMSRVVRRCGATPGHSDYPEIPSLSVYISRRSVPRWARCGQREGGVLARVSPDGSFVRWE